MATTKATAMKKDEFVSVVRDAFAQSAQFIDTEMSTERGRATDYYLGKPFGNEEDGRSQVILTEVRDAVDGMTPSLLRVVFGSEHVVEFAPNNKNTVEQAAQATDYVRLVFEQENGGFLKTLQVLKDGLVRKIGIFKWAWDDSVSVKSYRMEGLDEDQLTQLASDDSVRLARTVKRTIPADEASQQPETVVYDVDVIQTKAAGCAKVWALPPEEFLYNRQARDIEGALLLAHRTDKTRSELIALGVPEAVIDEHAGAGTSNDVSLTTNAEEIARRDIAGVGRFSGTGYMADPEMGKANAKILYADGLMRVDFDGDGVAELRRVSCIGPTYYPWKHYPADDTMGFAVFTPYPEPHTLVGGSVSDRTMDIQRINSNLMRGTLDSLSAALFPRMAYDTNKVSTADIMNTAIGGPIRVRGDINNALSAIAVPFTGKETLPILQFMQDTVERRTGRNKGAAGLDADALQSTGKEAVGAVLTGSQEQLEMIARVFCEMTLKPLFKGLYRLLTAYQEKSRVVKLRGSWVEVNPKTWEQDLDVTVNVALGSTFVEKKVATLMAVAADQKELAAATGGLHSPVMPLPKILATRAKILSLQGLKDFETYYTVLPPDWQPPPPPPTPPDPATQAIQAEHEMNQLTAVKELAIKQDELAFKREQAERDERLKLIDLADKKELALAEIEAKYHYQVQRDALQRATDADVAHAELTIDAHGQVHEQTMREQEHAHQVAMDEQGAALAEAQAAQTAQSAPAAPSEASA